MGIRCRSPPSPRPAGTAKARRKAKTQFLTEKYMLRIPSPLSDDVEELITRTIGCCITVHRELGAGLPEHAYAKALGLELNAAQIPFEREKRFPLTYRGEYLCDVYLDFIVAGSVVVEIKSVEHLAPI